MDGVSSTVDGELIKELPCYLIGQLGKNFTYNVSSLGGKDILDYALSVIAQAVEIVGGRFVLVECERVEKLIEYYKGNGFQMLPDPDDNCMHKFIRMIKPEDLIQETTA